MTTTLLMKEECELADHYNEGGREEVERERGGQKKVAKKDWEQIKRILTRVTSLFPF